MAPPLASRSTPRVYAWLRARLWRSDDQASATLISFVVGTAVFLVGVTYLLHFAMQPPGMQNSTFVSADLKSTGDRAMQVLMGTAGSPANWGSNADGAARLGLLEPGSSSILDPKKFDALAHGSSSSASSTNGYVDYDEAKAKLGLASNPTLGIPGYEFHLRSSPVISTDNKTYGVQGMTTYRVAYVGQYTNGAFTGGAQGESNALAALPIAYNGQLAPVGDLYQDDSSFLRSNLVSKLGISIAQTTIANGNGNTKYDFAVVNSSAVAPVVGSGAASRMLAIANGGIDSVSNLGFTKSREMRAVIGTANFTGLSSATMTWNELVDTHGDTNSYGFVELSPDGGADWYPVTSGLLGANALSTDTASALGGNWTSRSIAISASNCASCVNANAVQVAFHWVADSANPQGKGWLVDNIAITLASFSQNFEKPSYDMLVVGSNVAQNAFTANEVKSAIGDFVNTYGGRILVLGGEQNTQWLQPLMHVGISGSSSSVATPDTTHPLLSVPNELDWASYTTNNAVWDFSGGASQTLFTGVVQTTGGQDILAVSNTGAFGAYGQSGSVILTTYLPFTMGADQEARFFANALTYGKYRALYFDLGPVVPTDVPVSVSTRTATIDMSNDNSGVFTEIGLTMYIWKGAAASSSSSAVISVPNPPRLLNATPWNGAVYLNWTWPSTNGSTPVGTYWLYRGTSTGSETLYRTFSNTTFVLNDTGLTNGVTYYYNMTANNTQGNSTSSIELSATPSTVPGTPTLSTLSGAGTVSLSFSIINNGGSSLTGWNIYRGASSNAESLLVSLPATNSSFVDVLGSAGTTMYYYVTATNANGESANSSEKSATTVHVPGSTTAVAVADSFNHRINLSWVAATSVDIAAGIDNVTAYNIYAGNSTGTETFLVALPATNLSFIENNIANGTSRYYKITANGSAGEGSASGEVSATPAGLPGSPATLVVTTTANTAQSLTLTWTAPTSWGSGATPGGYVIYRGSSSGNRAQLAVVGVGTLSYQDDAVGANNATRYYSVVAYSNSGFGTNSTVQSGTTYGVPGAPTAAAAAGVQAVTLTWTAPTSPGLAITNYTIYRSVNAPGAETAYTSSGTTPPLSFGDTHLHSGWTYYYKITAWNAAGESVMSNEASAQAI